MEDQLSSALAHMPTMVKMTEFPTLQKCPLCGFTESHFRWSEQDHFCLGSLEATSHKQHTACVSWHNYISSASLLKIFRGQEIMNKTVSAIDRELTLDPPDMDIEVMDDDGTLTFTNDTIFMLTLKDTIASFSEAERLLNVCDSLDDDGEKLAAWMAATKVRRGYTYELSPCALMRIYSFIADSDCFLLHYFTSVELYTWGSAPPGTDDPFPWEAVSLHHRALRQQLENIGCYFPQSRYVTSWDSSGVLQFLEAQGPADVLAPPLIRPKVDRVAEVMPLGRGWSASVQFMIKLKALLNLNSIQMTRDACVVLPEELKRQVQLEVASGMIASNAAIMRSITIGEDLFPYQYELTHHLRSLMDVMREEFVFDSVFRSIKDSADFIDSLEEDYDALVMLKDRVISIPGAVELIRGEYEHMVFLEGI